jgi:hypothetical protein
MSMVRRIIVGQASGLLQRHVSRLRHNPIMMIRLCCAVTAAVGWFAFVPWCGPGAALAAPITTLPDAIPTRQTFFSIPFTVPPPTDASQAPVEVRLYVSADAGGTWALAAKVEPRQTSFSYRAPRDGEYWFAIRTVDRQGHIRPDRSSGPELRVIVDTLPPHLELAAWRAADGQIVVHWVGSDPLLKPESLKIECQQAGDPTWRLVGLDPPHDPGRSTYNGQASFRLNGTGQVTLRAEISDQAGNLATMQTIVRDDGAPAAGGVAASGTAPTNSTATSTVQLPASGAAIGPSTGATTAPTTGPAWPTDRVTNQTVGQSADATAGAASNGSPANTGSNSNASDHGPTFAPMLSSADPPTSGVMSPFNPPVENRFVAAGSGANSIFTQGLPPGERPYMVNSRRFALDYEIESAGAAGIAKIEIWGTRDAGRTWQSYGLQAAAHGPIKVKVDAEGLYGFRIVVVDGKGQTARPPHSGDLPELWVGVDLTKPLARITTSELGTGEHASELLIHYEASDAMLAARPVTLSFTDHAGGPYSTIAAGLENTGSYTWRFDSRVPERVFLRLEVRDEAGNVGVFETPAPISLDPDRPKGHIRTVHPLDDDGSSRVQTYQFYR